MTPIAVTGFSLLSVLGTRNTETRARLRSGEVLTLDPAPSDQAPNRSLRISEDIIQALGGRGWRQRQRPALLACLAAQRLLEENQGCIPKEAGIVLAANSNFYRPEFKNGVFGQDFRLFNPMTFLNSTSNMAAATVSIKYGLEGFTIGLGSGFPAGLEAIEIAARALQTGRATWVLAGGVEDDIPDMSFSLAESYQDKKNRQGVFETHPAGRIQAGEGCGLLLLEAESTAIARGAAIHAKILGFGQGSDYSGPADEPNAQAAVLAIQAALTEAKLPADAVEAIFLSANGSFVQDCSEAKAMNQVFGRPLPAVAVKAFLGETLHAAGALSAGLAILCLQQQFLPGTPQSLHPDWASGLDLASQARVCCAKRVLILANDQQCRTAAMLLEIIPQGA